MSIVRAVLRMCVVVSDMFKKQKRGIKWRYNFNALYIYIYIKLFMLINLRMFFHSCDVL